MNNDNKNKTNQGKNTEDKNQELLRLKKELEEKKKLLEQKLQEIEKEKHGQLSDDKAQDSKDAGIKNKFWRDSEDEQMSQERPKDHIKKTVVKSYVDSDEFLYDDSHANILGKKSEAKIKSKYKKDALETKDQKQEGVLGSTLKNVIDEKPKLRIKTNASHYNDKKKPGQDPAKFAKEIIEESRVHISDKDRKLEEQVEIFSDSANVEEEYGSNLIGKSNYHQASLKEKYQQQQNDQDQEIIKASVQKAAFVKSFDQISNGRNALPDLKVNTPKQRIFRHELKFYITWADYMMLSKSLNCLLKYDENADENGDYDIRSLYFDDYKNTALVDKLAGNENRKKYRIRIYGLSDDFIRLERKNKTKDYISKDNLTLSKQEYEKVICGDIGFLLKKDNPLAKDFYYELKTKDLRPAVIVDYVRMAYVHPIKNLRITFDKMVKTGRYDTSIFKKDMSLASVLPPGMVVMEVKFEKGLPDTIIGVLNTVSGSVRSAISKYVLCRKYES